MASFREEVVVDALDSRDWKALQAEIGTAILDEASADKLIQLVLQSRKLVFRYPGPTKKRTEIIDGIVRLIRGRFGDERAEEAAQAFAVFPLIDEGYAGLRTLISSSPLAAHSPPQRLSALLELFALQIDSMTRMASEVPSGEVLSGRVLLGNPETGQFAFDAATVKFVEFATMSIMIEAHGSRWIGSDSIIRVPRLPRSGVGDIEAAQQSFLTAFVWQQWQSIEERVRYFGDRLVRRAAPDVDATLPSEATVLQHDASSTDWHIYDAISNERLGERLNQTYLELLEQTYGQIDFDGLRGNSSVIPDARLSLEEVHSATMLSELLGFDTATDLTKYGGLTLMEWLRGYAVLQLVAREAASNGITPQERWFPQRRIGLLHGLLRRKGLTGSKATTFIDLVSLSESSRDLYDAPLIRSEGDTYTLAVVAMKDAILLRLLLSTFATKRFKIERKGEAFEEYIRSHLSRQGLRAKHVATSRDGDSFEFDALVPWGDYLFLFECKNRSLSAGNIIASYRFRQGVGESVKQVKRLVAALETHPDIISNSLGASCVGLKIVPVVVHSMPFSIPGGVDGVYFWDASAMTRFFKERFIHASSVHRIGDRLLKHRVPTYSFWRGERPTPEDFLAQIDNPAQVELLRKDMKLDPLNIRIGDNLFATTIRARRKMGTLETTLEAMGVTPNAVLSEFRRVEQDLILPLRELFRKEG